MKSHDFNAVLALEVLFKGFLSAEIPIPMSALKAYIFYSTYYRLTRGQRYEVNYVINELEKDKFIPPTKSLLYGSLFVIADHCLKGLHDKRKIEIWENVIEEIQKTTGRLNRKAMEKGIDFGVWVIEILEEGKTDIEYYRESRKEKKNDS